MSQYEMAQHWSWLMGHPEIALLFAPAALAAIAAPAVALSGGGGARWALLVAGLIGVLGGSAGGPALGLGLAALGVWAAAALFLARDLRLGAGAGWALAAAAALAAQTAVATWITVVPPPSLDEFMAVDIVFAAESVRAGVARAGALGLIAALLAGSPGGPTRRFARGHALALALASAGLVLIDGPAWASGLAGPPRAFVEAVAATPVERAASALGPVLFGAGIALALALALSAAAARRAA